MSNKRQPNIDSTKEAILMSLKDVYDDIEEQRKSALEKLETFYGLISEKEDVVSIAKSVADQQKVIEGAIKNKLDVIKMQFELHKSEKKVLDEEDEELDSITSDLKSNILKSKKVGFDD